MSDLRLGKTPARAAVSFRFRSYFDPTGMPSVPVVFGKPWLVTSWGVFGNDVCGDCVWAGAAHETMLWGTEVGSPATFTDASVLSEYSSQTGYNPADPSTDQGSDMHAAASYRRKSGIADADGTRHQIDAYVALNVGDINELALAAYLFGAVGLGLQLPASALDQFDRAEPWDVVASTTEGGHYVPVVGRNSHGNFLVVTWGRLQACTPRFIQSYNDETVAYLSLSRMKGKLSPQGFDESTLRADLAKLTKGTVL